MIVVSVSSLIEDVREAAAESTLGATVGRKAVLRVIRVLGMTDALTERRATECIAEAEAWPDLRPTVWVARFRRLW